MGLQAALKTPARLVDGREKLDAADRMKVRRRAKAWLQANLGRNSCITSPLDAPMSCSLPRNAHRVSPAQVRTTMIMAPSLTRHSREKNVLVPNIQALGCEHR
jgi:hypothetical protein